MFYIDRGGKMNIEYYTETMKEVEEAKFIFEGLEDIKNNCIV